ncbi:hypothetical protein [Streptomyces sp. CB03238]|uniref:hypothetical protein n=1 Tax=Streptomyces sp. CB03238 TaxID=1907777 RepID=UPI000A0FC949|nr:hypothetical protein [Streptomyces sp. CB03238]ORT53482.1 hypothetical protein BKD26_38265 [Streptomyces sp. CB03238]
MIRLPSTHAAITAPLVASNAVFPGIPIGRSMLDGRPFHLSPVLTSDKVLPSTNSLALGGLGSGKSTTAKVRAHREIIDNQHQYVVIDSFGEDNAGEWGPLTRARGGRVIEAGSFTLNPCSGLFPSEVREQLIRSLILAVEPAALNPQATHALQHALNHPKATSLNGLVDALVRPEDGRWTAAKLTDWGEGAAIALSRYTEGSLRGLFDGQDASLPPTDLPILSFDFSRLDRNSPAIPSLMAAVTCWVEHVWLRQSTAVHRHLVVEEAWQILLSPATAELIQRLLKNSRKAALSVDAVMHTLSDLGDGKAQDLAKLCEIAHVGRLGPEEAAIVGALLGLPQWAIDAIPTLSPGQAVWKVGPDYVDLVETVLSEEEAALTDTSSRRRKAQQTLTLEKEAEAPTEPDAADDDDQDEEPPPPEDDSDEGEVWDWDMPPTVIDIRHRDVIRAAMEGRCSEAAQLAAIGEREDITAHGINSDEAVSWLSTRARVAELCGSPDAAVRLRATVARMGKEVEWYERTDTGGEPAWHSVPEPEPLTPDPAAPPPKRRRTWPYIAVIAALAIGTGVVWQHSEEEQQRQERQEKAAAYKGWSGAEVDIDGVTADVFARWSKDGKRVVLKVKTPGQLNAKYLRLDAAGESAVSEKEGGLFPRYPEIALPVEDYFADVTVRVAVGGNTWKEGSRAASRTIRLSPTGKAFDAETGKKLPYDALF